MGVVALGVVVVVAVGCACCAQCYRHVKISLSSLLWSVRASGVAVLVCVASEVSIAGAGAGVIDAAVAGVAKHQPWCHLCRCAVVVFIHVSLLRCIPAVVWFLLIISLHVVPSFRPSVRSAFLFRLCLSQLAAHNG